MLAGWPAGLVGSGLGAQLRGFAQATYKHLAADQSSDSLFADDESFKNCLVGLLGLEPRTKAL